MISETKLGLGVRKLALPAGKYVISDPCYLVRDENWDTVLNDSDYFRKPIGKYTNKSGEEVSIIAFHTRHGDGRYRDNSGNEYPVDAGLIGIVRHSDLETVPGDSVIIDFNEPFEVYSPEEGIMMFGHIAINTADQNEDPSEEEFEEEYNDEDEWVEDEGDEFESEG